MKLLCSCLLLLLLGISSFVSYGAPVGIHESRERISIFESSAEKEKSPVRSGSSAVRVRGVGGLIALILVEAGINVWMVLALLGLSLAFVILFSCSKLESDWGATPKKDTYVFDVGEAKDNFFDCHLCHGRHSRNDAALVVLHGNRQLLKNAAGKDIVKETDAICRVPICSVCNAALMNKARTLNTYFILSCALAFICATVVFYCLYFTFMSSLFFGLLAMVVVGIARIMLCKLHPQRFPLSMNGAFSCIPGITALEARGFKVGKSSADIVEEFKDSDER